MCFFFAQCKFFLTLLLYMFYYSHQYWHRENTPLGLSNCLKLKCFTLRSWSIAQKHAAMYVNKTVVIKSNYITSHTLVVGWCMCIFIYSWVLCPCFGANYEIFVSKKKLNRFIFRFNHLLKIEKINNQSESLKSGNKLKW